MATVTQLQRQSAIVPAKYLIPIISKLPGEDGLLLPQSYSIPLPPPSNRPTKVLDIDKDTPDRHVPRDARLIRLTGVHPLNVEAPLTTLYDEGFITSPEMFYVRNHGAVPEIPDEDIWNWELSIEGLVEHPVVLTFRQIQHEFEQITLPITLVCAGNRRKEQNQVQKSKGFSWGAAGVSTALFTGPLMSEVLRRARPLRKAKYVCMEGADTLPHGHYATSLKLSWVMDPTRGIMLAHKQNGEALRPDHGRPLRAVIPGQIGGRSVKWLKRLIVTDAPSDNWYHIYDNRVLPTMVSTDMSSKDPKWWYDERYAIFDLSVNSAIVYPQHDEELEATSLSSYNARGYAYGGGGRRVSRVEISLDVGRTWRLADIEYPEDKYRDADQDLYGGRIDMLWRETCFCWCFWSLEIPVSDLETSNSILVRAMDEAMNIQPRDMYWSVLGMMNNPWFRVTVTRVNGVLKFEHPTQPAMIPGGWMERVKNSGGDLQNGDWGERSEGARQIKPQEPLKTNMKKLGLNKTISIDEFRSQKSETQPWFAVEGEVYDGTHFLEDHPGGAHSIIAAAGKDATDEFLAIHSETAKAMLVDYHIGTLDSTSQRILKSDLQEEQLSKSRPVFLEPRFWASATLIRKKVISQDTRIFTFQLDHDSQLLGLPVGQHVMLKINDPSASTKETIIRPYTPVSEKNACGTLDLLVKVYYPMGTRPGGKLTMALEKLSMGCEVEFKGPIGKFEYLSKGRITVGGKERQVQSFYMICGGSGITPIFQVLRAIMQDEGDNTSCIVLDGNRSEEDILCRSELDSLASQNTHRCKIIHTLEKPSEAWTGHRGFITKDVLEKYVVCGDGGMVLICGPPLMEASVRRLLLEQGWDKSDLHSF